MDWTRFSNPMSSGWPRKHFRVACPSTAEVLQSFASANAAARYMSELRQVSPATARECVIQRFEPDAPYPDDWVAVQVKYDPHKRSRNPSRIQLSEGWPLRGASSTAELNRILNDLHDHRGNYDETASRLGLPRAVVAKVAAHYQSLWMHL